MGGGGAWFGKKDRPAPHFIVGASRGYQASQGPVDPQLAEYTASQKGQPAGEVPPSAQAAPALSTAGGRLDEKKISLYPQVGGTDGNRTPFPSRESSVTGGTQEQVPGASEHAEILSKNLEEALRKNAEGARDGEKAEVVAQSGVLVVGGREGGKEAEVEAEEEVLITLPGAMVHLIDGEVSLLLTLGDLRVVRLTQRDSGMLAMVKVGENLSWPLGWDEPVFKIDSHRYVFTLQVPDNLEESLDVLNEGASEEGAAGAEKATTPTLSKSSSGSRTLHASTLPGGLKEGRAAGGGGEVMSYGLTLPPTIPQEDLQHLDLCLQHYSIFSEPQIVASEGVGAAAATSFTAPPGKGEKSQGAAVLTAGETQVAAAKKLSEAAAVADVTSANAVSATADLAKAADAGALVPQNSEDLKMAEQNAAYWTTVAPNVNDYRTEVARGIAEGSGGVIHGLFYITDMAAGQLQRVESYAISKLKPGDKPLQISPRMVRRVQQ